MLALASGVLPARLRPAPTDHTLGVVIDCETCPAARDENMPCRAATQSDAAAAAGARPGAPSCGRQPAGTGIELISRLCFLLPSRGVLSALVGTGL